MRQDELSEMISHTQDFLLRNDLAERCAITLMADALDKVEPMYFDQLHEQSMQSTQSTSLVEVVTSSINVQPNAVDPLHAMVTKRFTTLPSQASAKKQTTGLKRVSS